MGEVGRVPKAGGSVEILAETQLSPWGLAVDDTYVYWANQGRGDAPNTGTIQRRAKSGGAIEVLASGEQGPDRLALDADAVYFVNGPWGDVNGSLRRVAKSGGEVTVLQRHLDEIFQIAVSGAFVYYVDYFSHHVRGIPTNGSGAPDVVQESFDVFGLAAAPTGVVAVSRDDAAGTAHLRNVGAGLAASASPLAQWPASNDVWDRCIVADATNVYWIDTVAGHATVRVAPLR